MQIFHAKINITILYDNKLYVDSFGISMYFN